MHNEEMVRMYDELVAILASMPVPDSRRNLRKQTNVRWLLRNIKDEWGGAQQAKDILEICDESRESVSAHLNPIWQSILKERYADEEAMRERYLREKGLEVTTMSSARHPKRVFSVKLGFTAEEWLNLLNRDGDLLPVCCAVVSEVRDILTGAIVEGGFIEAEELYKASELLKDHDCQSGSDPVGRIIATWEAIKEDAYTFLVHYTRDVGELEGACSVISRGITTLSLNWLGADPSEDDTYHHCMTRQLTLARILPAITTIYKSLSAGGVEPMDGYAICDGDEVMLYSLGCAIFPTESRAKEIIAVFKRLSDEEAREQRERKVKYKVDKKMGLPVDPPRERKTPRYKVRSVRVTLENGIEFKD